jgi:hypothetical protein
LKWPIEPRRPWQVANVAVDNRRIRPIRLDGEDGETMLLNEMTRNGGPRPIELGCTVARLAEQHHTLLGKASKQAAKSWIIAIRQRFGGAGDQVRQVGRA